MPGVGVVLGGGVVLVTGAVLGVGTVGMETVGASTDAGMDMVEETSANFTSHSTDTFHCAGQ